MNIFRFQGGYKFCINDQPSGLIDYTHRTQVVALVPSRQSLFRCKTIVKKGSNVLLGQVLFYNKKNNNIKFVSPESGVIENIIYGNKRSLKAIEIKKMEQKETDFISFKTENILNISKDLIIKNLVESGILNRIKIFPGFEFIENLDDLENGKSSLLVSLFSTEPNMPQYNVLLENKKYTKYFLNGINICCRLFKKIHMFNNTTEWQEDITEMSRNVSTMELHTIDDKYPAENPGLQYFLIKQQNKLVDSLKYMYTNMFTIIEIGYLFSEGKVLNKTFLSLSGNALNSNVHAIVKKGSKITDIVNEIGLKKKSDNRYIAGGLFTGNKVDIMDYITDDDYGIQAIEEDRNRVFLSFLRLGAKNLTLLRTWISSFSPNTSYTASTSNQGEERACIQCGYCYDVCPVQIMPSLLMKSSIINNIEKMEHMQIHHCIECELCTFVCPSKIAIGQHIKDGKEFIKKEG